MIDTDRSLMIESKIFLYFVNILVDFAIFESASKIKFSIYFVNICVGFCVLKLVDSKYNSFTTIYIVLILDFLLSGIIDYILFVLSL